MRWQEFMIISYVFKTVQVSRHIFLTQSLCTLLSMLRWPSLNVTLHLGRCRSCGSFFFRSLRAPSNSVNAPRRFLWWSQLLYIKLVIVYPFYPEQLPHWKLLKPAFQFLIWKYTDLHCRIANCLSDRLFLCSWKFTS